MCQENGRGVSTQYRLSDLASETVFDKAGNQVARLDDLTMGANGRIISVTLAPDYRRRRQGTVPFEKLRIKKERNGTLSLETDVVLKVFQRGHARRRSPTGCFAGNNPRERLLLDFPGRRIGLAAVVNPGKQLSCGPSFPGAPEDVAVTLPPC